MPLVKISPQDPRRHYLAKIVRAGQPLPAPSDIAQSGMRGLAGPLESRGDAELIAGDFLFECEQTHHRKLRGYRTRVVFVGSDGELRVVEPTARNKATMKAAGMTPEMLTGAGLLAACVRIAHAIRLGIAWEQP